jgi:hypothetical protein
MSVLFAGIERRQLLLKQLDVSGILATRAFLKSVTIPLTLERFIANDVDFRLEPFEGILRSLFQARKPLAISLKNVGLKLEDLDSLFRQFITRVPPPRGGYMISEFHWDENFVMPSLFLLLEKCAKLRVLSIRAIPTVGQDPTRAITQFLSRHPTLEELRIGGSTTRPMTPAFFTAIAQCLQTENRVLTVFDIGQTPFTDGIVRALVALLFGNRIIQSLVCGGTGVTNPGILTGFLTELLSRGAGVAVAISRSDIDAMYKARSLTFDSHRELLNLVVRVKAGDPTIPIPPETVQLPYQEAELQMAAVSEDDATEPRGGNDEVQRPPTELDPDEFTPLGSPIPAPDNDALLREFAERYSILALITRIKMDREAK